jgi:hypothetical protein
MKIEAGLPIILNRSVKHLKNIYAEGEFSENTTVSKMETVVNRGFMGESICSKSLFAPRLDTKKKIIL